MENKELKETAVEWQPKRGDRVLVFDYENSEPLNAIYLETVIGCTYPFLVVSIDSEEDFLKGNKFDFVTQYKHMKPIETELPAEADFKSKVVELIEKRIERYKECEKGSLEMSDEHDAIEYKAIANQFKDFLNQIKQLQIKGLK